MKTTIQKFQKGAKMLKGIVKQNGEVVSLDGLQKAVVEVLIMAFRENLVNGVNEHGVLVRYDRELPGEVAVGPDKVQDQGGNGEPAAATETEQEAPVETTTEQPETDEQPEPTETQTGPKPDTGSGIQTKK